MHIKKIVVPGVLATSLIGTVLVAGQVGPASAGPGASQDASAVLDLATPELPRVISRCPYDESEPCITNPTESVPIYKLTLAFGYTYTPGQVNEAPDVTTWAGKLPDLSSYGGLRRCSGKVGLAFLATGAKITSSKSELRMNKDGGSMMPSPTTSPDPSPSPNKITSAAGDAYCLG